MTNKYLKGLRFENLILKETDHYIIINKPPYISTLEDRNDPHNILELAKGYHPDAQVCHRLDKETSGILVIAKDPEAYRHFAMALERRQVKKIYHAVIDGLHDFENLEADEPILSTNSKSRIDYREGKPSMTLVSTVERFKQHTLVRCFPVTGRLHQIRVHLAFHQAPVSCDPLYGGEFIYLSWLKRNFKLAKNDENEKSLITRVALHAYSITFHDFYGGPDDIMEITAPYPKDFEVLVHQLRKNL